MVEPAANPEAIDIGGDDEDDSDEDEPMEQQAIPGAVYGDLKKPDDDEEDEQIN